LSAEWWQWALSIPTPVNPVADTTGDNCMVGQRGPIWFLAGFFGTGSTATRNCSVPEGTPLFFPVVNNVNVNTPHICGQGDDLTVAQLRELVAPFIDSVTKVSVQLDGKAINGALRVQSEAFEAALPEDNVFVAPCSGDSPEGIYSPAVDDGFYVELGPLTVGSHMLHFQAKARGTVQDITYNLTVVPVSLK
jgi:hypothetical protein